MAVRLEGLPEWNDRRWLIKTPDFEAEITDYNWEITGYDKRLHELYPDDIHYSGNAYWVTGAWAEKMGFTVEALPRKPRP